MGIFSRNKKPAPPTTLDEAQAKILGEIQESLDRVEKYTDAGKKLLMLHYLGDIIETRQGEAQLLINNRARKRFTGPFLGGTGGGAIVAATLAASLHFPPLLVIVGPGICGGFLLGTWRENLAYRRLTDENHSYFEALQTQKAKASHLADALLQKDLQAVVKSSYFTRILNEVPRARDHFAAAMQRGDLTVARKPHENPQPPSGGRLQL